MSSRRTLLPSALAAILCVILGTSCLASKADELLLDARKAIAAAQRSKSSADRNENYEKALKLYNQVAGDKQNAGTLQAAMALYEIAIVNQEISARYGTEKDRYKHLYASHETLKRLLNQYDKPSEVLSVKLMRGEIKQALRIVSNARKLKTRVAIELDEKNSEKIQYKILDFFVAITGRVTSFSYWFAIILVTVLVKLIITPLTKAQFKAMKEMQKVAPLIKQIQAEHRGDQKTIGEKTMALYKEHSINPFASCLPILIQFPILLALYSMIRSYEFQFAKGTFLWIGSGLSHLASFQVPFNPTAVVWVTAKDLAEPDLILVMLYLVSMYISTKLSAVDPTQAEQQKMMAIVMPIMFAFIFAGFPAAFLLYWLVFNILQTTQQYLILRGGPGEPPALAPAAPPSPPATDEPSPDRVSRGRRRRRR